MDERPAAGLSHASMPPLRDPTTGPQSGLDEFLRLLAEQLRIRGLPERRVREIAAEVEQHVRDTGEDPVAAFGAPDAYAAPWVPAFTWAAAVRRVVLGSFGVLGLWMLMTAVMGRRGVPGTREVGTFELTNLGIMVIALVLVPWTVRRWESNQRARAMLTGRRSSARWWVAFATVAVLAGVVVAVVADTIEPSGVHVTVPLWVLVVGGVALLPLLFFVRGPGDRQRPTPLSPGVGGST